MSVNMAVKRAEKAKRHKAMLEERRKLALIEASLPAQVARAAAHPIRKCCFQAHDGLANIVLIRGDSEYRVAFAAFLVDTWCLGVKDVMFSWLGAEAVALRLEGMEEGSPLTDIAPADARKLLADAAAYGAALGFAPHKDFRAAEGMFGDVDVAAATQTFPLGRNGRPCYMPSPFESRAQIRQRLSQLERRVGADGFDYTDAPFD